MRTLAHVLPVCVCVCAYPSEPAGAHLCQRGKRGGEGEQGGMERKRREECVCVCVCHGVCESELVSVRNCACLSVRSVQAEQIRMCRSY